MRLLPIVLAPLLGGLLLTALARPAALQDDHAEEETPLAREMLRVKDALRDLRRSVRDPERKEDSLASVLECQDAALLAKREVPAMAERLPAAEREAFLRDYRLEMIRFERALLDLEQALLEGAEVDRLRELYEVVKEMETPAHGRFTEDG